MAVLAKESVREGIRNWMGNTFEDDFEDDSFEKRTFNGRNGGIKREFERSFYVDKDQEKSKNEKAKKRGKEDLVIDIMNSGGVRITEESYDFSEVDVSEEISDQKPALKKSLSCRKKAMNSGSSPKNPLPKTDHPTNKSSQSSSMNNSQYIETERELIPHKKNENQREGRRDSLKRKNKIRTEFGEIANRLQNYSINFDAHSSKVGSP